MMKLLSYVMVALFAVASVNAFAAKHMAGEPGAGMEKKEKKADKKQKKAKKEMKKEEKK